MASTKTQIRDFYGRIIGTIETDNFENKTARDFYGRIVGYYDKKLNVTRDFYKRIVGYYDKRANVTRDFYKRIVGRGNMLTGLIMQAEVTNKK